MFVPTLAFSLPQGRAPEATFRCSTLGQAPGRIHIHQTRLNRSNRDNRNTAAYWAHSHVTKKIKCCEYGHRSHSYKNFTSVISIYFYILSSFYSLVFNLPKFVLFCLVFQVWPHDILKETKDTTRCQCYNPFSFEFMYWTNKLECLSLSSLKPCHVLQGKLRAKLTLPQTMMASS